MRSGISIAVTPEDRLRLEAIAGDGNAKQKHVKRAKVILLTTHTEEHYALSALQAGVKGTSSRPRRRRIWWPRFARCCGS